MMKSPGLRKILPLFRRTLLCMSATCVQVIAPAKLIAPNWVCAYWSTSTQSWVPSACAALGVVKFCEPLLAKGEPVIVVEVLVVGSYQEAVMAFENIPIFTLSGVVVAATDVYTMAAEA